MEAQEGMVGESKAGIEGLLMLRECHEARADVAF